MARVGEAEVRLAEAKKLKRGDQIAYRKKGARSITYGKVNFVTQRGGVNVDEYRPNTTEVAGHGHGVWISYSWIDAKIAVR